MTNLEMDKMNENLYSAAMHLFEASKYLSDVDKKFAIKYIADADKLLSIIKPIEETKVSEEEVDSILDEIFNIKEK